MLPSKIFLTGVPGSRWSGIAQVIEQLDGMNISDRNADREYSHSLYSGHKGAYFGPGMEFEPRLDEDYINSAWADSAGCKVVKSHEWSEMLPDIHKAFPEDWIMLVHRQHKPSLEWWLEAGGYNISYPDYTAYNNMEATIKNQNKSILAWVFKQNCKLERFTPFWIESQFGQSIDFEYSKYEDIFVTLWKP
mgnify:CR=1 FL=1